MTEHPYRIFKYPVSLTDSFTVAMNQEAQILTVQLHYGQPVMWALVHPSVIKAERRFRLIGTGHPIDMGERHRLDYIGTFQLDGGLMVFHLFEERA